MGDRMMQGSLARGMSKLRRATRSARPRGPSALPSNHEIVSDGCQLSLHPYKFPATCRGDRPAKKSGSRLTYGVEADASLSPHRRCRLP